MKRPLASFISQPQGAGSGNVPQGLGPETPEQLRVRGTTHAKRVKHDQTDPAHSRSATAKTSSRRLLAPNRKVRGLTQPGPRISSASFR